MRLFDTIKAMPSGDKAMFAGIIASIGVWWYFDGRKRYGLGSDKL